MTGARPQDPPPALPSRDRPASFHRALFLAPLLALIAGSPAVGRPPWPIDELPILERPAESAGATAMVATRRWPTYRFPVRAGHEGYARARRALDLGRLPSPADLGSGPLLPPELGVVEVESRPRSRAFEIDLECFPSPWRQGSHLLWIRVLAPPPDDAPIDVIVVADLRDGEWIASSAEAVASHLENRDRFGFIAPHAGVDGDRIPVPVARWARGDIDATTRRIGERRSLDQLLIRGYEMAVREAGPRRSVSLVLLTDRGFEKGGAGEDRLRTAIARRAESGITLSILAAPGALPRLDALRRLAAAGQGRFAFADHPGAAAAVLRRWAHSRWQVAGTGLEAEVEFEAGSVSHHRFLGHAPGPREEGGGAQEVPSVFFTGEGAEGLFELTRSRDAIGTLARLRLRSAARPDVPLAERRLTSQGLLTSARHASPGALLTSVLATLGDKLVGSYWSTDLPYRRLLEPLSWLPATTRYSPPVAELRYLIRRALALSTSAPAPERTADSFGDLPIVRPGAAEPIPVSTQKTAGAAASAPDGSPP